MAWKRIISVISVLVISGIFTAAQLHADQTIGVTGSIPPKDTDFQLAITSDLHRTANQTDFATYTITYGSHLYYRDTLTIEADWSQGILDGASAPSIEGLQYVLGSATKAYNLTSPVIDEVNKKIIWTIPSFPAQLTDQTLQFRVAFTNAYTGYTTVHFPVRVRIAASNFTTADQLLTLDYLYHTFPAKTSFPSPTVTPAPIPSISPIPSPNLTITHVTFTAISDTKADVRMTTSIPAKVTLFYGTSPSSLSQTVLAGDSGYLTQTSLTKLSPNRQYFLQAIATDASGNKVISEIFTFKTAPQPPIVDVTKSSAIVISNGNVLSSINQQDPQKDSQATVLPTNADYEISYTIPPSTDVNFLEAVIRNKNVLGISTDQSQPSTHDIAIVMVEKQPGVYYAQLPPIASSGTYEIYIRIAEKNGNLYEQKVSDITVSLPLQIVEKTTNQPLEDARVFFYFYNIRTKQYEPISQSFGNIKNPQFSDGKGYVNVVLPKGDYRVEVSGLFHGQVTQMFRIDKDKGYPVISLEKQPYNLMSFVRYFTNTILDFVMNLNTYVADLSVSVRYFNVLATLIVAFSVFLSFLLFSMRAYIPLTTLPTVLYHHLHHTLLPRHETILFGKVVSENNIPLALAEVYFLDEDKKVLARTTTNRQGGFSYKKQQESAIVEVIKEGYDRISQHIPKGNTIEITLPDHHHVTNSFRQELFRILARIISFFLEAIMALSLFLELAFVAHFGFWRSLPFFILSAANITLWLFYTKETVRNFLKK